MREVAFPSKGDCLLQRRGFVPLRLFTLSVSTASRNEPTSWETPLRKMVGRNFMPGYALPE
jgi:hypothetical protein